VRERLNAIREAVTGNRVFQETASMASKMREAVTPERIMIISGFIAVISLGVVVGAGLATEGNIQVDNPLILVPSLTALISTFSARLALEKLIR